MDAPPCRGRPDHEMRVSVLGVDYCSQCGWVPHIGGVPAAEPRPRSHSRPASARKVAALIARDGDRCHYCGRRLNESNRTIDEQHPRSKGGRCVLDNQVLACSVCNQDKADRLYDEYVELVARTGSAWDRRLRLFPNVPSRTAG